MWDEMRVRKEAGGRHGLLSRAQLQALGVSRKEMADRIRSGRLVKLHPGVYYLDSIAATWKTAVLASVLAAGPDALSSHRTAAILWNFDAFYSRVIEVTVPYAESPVPNSTIVHRSRRANPQDVVDGIPITTPERTLFDLAPIVPWSVLEKATRSAVHQNLTTPSRLDHAVGRFGGRGVAGTRRMRTLVGVIRDDLSGSVAEIDLKHIIQNAPIPPAVQQLQIPLPDGSNAYPDFCWPDQMKVVEVDGFEAHGTPQQLQRDLRRQNALLALGWEIRRFTATEVRLERRRVAQEVATFVNAASVKVYAPPG